MTFDELQVNKHYNFILPGENARQFVVAEIDAKSALIKFTNPLPDDPDKYLFRDLFKFDIISKIKGYIYDSAKKFEIETFSIEKHFFLREVKALKNSELIFKELFLNIEQYEMRSGYQYSFSQILETRDSEKLSTYTVVFKLKQNEN